MHISVELVAQLLPGQHAAPGLVESILLSEFLVFLPFACQLQPLPVYGLVLLLQLLVQRHDCLHKHLLLRVLTRLSLLFVLVFYFFYPALSRLPCSLLH